MSLFVVMDIGCLECGEESACLGVFSTKEEAGRIAEAAKQNQRENWQGQHEFMVVEVPGVDIAGEYAEVES